MKFGRPLSLLTATLLALLAFSPLATHALERPVQQLRIHTVIDETNEPFFDTCYELAGYSIAPQCDRDADGVITFDYVPTGTYTLVQTADIGELYPIGEPGISLNAIEVRETDNNDYRVRLVEAGENTDLGLITRDPDTGEVIEGACYELAGYSNVGCDDDNNGIIMFETIPWGTYTVRQTETPPGYEPMGDYEINLVPFPEGGNGPVIIPLLQADEQGSETSTNISVQVVNADTGGRIENESTCIQFPGMTQSGCDDDVTDGQIDFMGVDPTFGQPTFEVQSLACGYEATKTDNVIMHRYGEFHISLVLHTQVIPTDCAE